MNLVTALSKVHQVVGMTSLIDAIIGGDLDSVKEQNLGSSSLERAELELTNVTQAQKECKSDSAYWGYMGQISCWRAMVSIMKAAELVGEENLLDIDLKQGGVVMDQCANVERYGKAILEAAEQLTSTRETVI